VVALRNAAGVARFGCGQLGEDGVEGGAGFRRQMAGDRAHPIDVLSADGDAPPPCAIMFGEIAVGVQAVGEFVGKFA
jgi:hypothetical protein